MTGPRQDHYPGLMERTRRFLDEHLPQIDLVLEVADARAPRTSRWQGLDALLGDRRRVLILNKADLADDEQTALWLDHYGSLGVRAWATALMPAAGVRLRARRQKAVLSAARLRSAVGRLAAAAGSRRGRAFKVAVVGIPNVGKSSALNAVAGRKRAPTGARPGVTRGRQWAVVSGRLWLLDLPGVLPPAPRDDDELWRLALIGALPEANYDPLGAAVFLLRELIARLSLNGAAGALGLEAAPDEAGATQLLKAFARRRGLIGPGGGPDLHRAAQAVLVTHRRGGLGPLTIEEAPHDG